MFCSNCGKELKEEWAACPQCGALLRKEERTVQAEVKTPKKKSKKIWIILCMIVVVIVGAVGLAISGDSEEQEIIDKLQEFTSVYKVDGKYCFIDDEENWTLTYTSENEFVSFQNDTVIECFTDAFGEGCFSEGSASDSGFSYDLSDNEARIYFDVDVEEGHLSSVSYNLPEREYDLMVDLHHWTASKEFEDLVAEYGLAESIEQDVKEFKDVLKQHKLTVGDLLKVNYDTLKAQSVPDMEKVAQGNREAEALVQTGTYGDYTDVSIQEVLEYNWKGGVWDSFVENLDGEKEALIVEYAADEDRKTVIQFQVDLEKEEFAMVSFTVNDKSLEETEAHQEVDQMYYAYFAAKFPLDQIDLADYTGKNISELLQASEAFCETDEDLMLYEDVSRQAMIMLDEKNSIYMVSLEGDGTYTPEFAGNKVGGSLSGINASELGKRGYTVSDSDNEYYAVYENPENQSVVMFEAEEGIITSIRWTAGIDEEIAEETTDESEYIFPDSDSRYLSEEEVRSVEADKLAYARNEIFARHGRMFNDAELAAYFEGMSWYEGTIPADQFDADAVFNDFEKKNVELIKKVEAEVNGADSFIGKTGVYISTGTVSGGWTGQIEILEIKNNRILFDLGTLDYDGPSHVMAEEAKITDDHTAQITSNGFTITFTWTDAENMYVTNTGQYIGTDSDIVMSVTDNQAYIRPTEFNR